MKEAHRTFALVTITTYILISRPSSEPHTAANHSVGLPWSSLVHPTLSFKGHAARERRHQIPFPSPSPSPYPLLLPLCATALTMTSTNGLVCFTNCFLALEDGSLVEKDLWIDERRGVILDSQVRLYVCTTVSSD
jgi:hypothetical protein